MGSSKSPCMTSYMSIRDHSSKLLSFWENCVYFCILATDKQTDKQTDGQTDGHHRCVKLQSRYRELRLNNNLRSCVSGATCEVLPVFSYLLTPRWVSCVLESLLSENGCLLWSIQTQVFWKPVFEVFCQTPKTGLISICLLQMDVQPSTKSYQLQEGEEGAKQPPDKGSAPGSCWGLRPYPPVIGFIAGCRWQKCGFQFAFTVQTARNLVS